MSDAEPAPIVTEPDPLAPPAPRLGGRRLKLLAILASAVLAVVILGAWTQVWFTVELSTGQVLEITGDIAAPALTALALCVLVLLAALAIAGPFFRVVLSILEALIGVAVVYSAILAVASPIGASSAAITTATGVGGKDSTADLALGATQSAWPWVSLIAGALLVVVALATLLTSGRWPGSSRKYQPVRLEGPVAERTAVDDWDSLSSGDDPTETPAPGAEPST